MKKLELKHIGPYLPYELRIAIYDNLENEFVKSHVMVYEVAEAQSWVYGMKDVLNGKTLHGSQLKPVLRPLSEVFEITTFKMHNGKETETYPISYMSIDLDELQGLIKHDCMGALSYEDTSFLLMNHFDVFGLIDKGLAININTIKP